MTKRLAVLTSGGDAQGMNAAVRAVVRAALERGTEIYAVHEGYQGMIAEADRILPMDWNTVGGILYRGGTVIGSARCPEFMTKEGRLKAVRNLLAHGIDGLIVIGGDGSLTGANRLRQEWPELLQTLIKQGDVTPQQARTHRILHLVGMVGSIDNDMFGTDMTIGADSALHRITDAVDAISSTAASHQRAFVIEVMGRHCGYLAMMSALASGANWVLIPESPPALDNWEAKMCEVLSSGRETGRRDSIVIVAEGAVDHHGKAITCEYVRKVLEEQLGEDTRVTILGHVQRGGSPSAFDRNLSTLLGVYAVDVILEADENSPAYLVGWRGNRVAKAPLMECVRQTHAVTDAIHAGNFKRALELRGRNFQETFRTLRTLVRALPHPPKPGQKRLRLAVLNADSLAPGMNTAVRSAVRIALDKGHFICGVQNGFEGLIQDDMDEFSWMSVTGWAGMGGSELGTTRKIPEKSDFYAIARTIEEREIEGLLVIGGWSGYLAAYRLYEQRPNFPAFNIPIVCLPATIDNNLPGSELSVGADTAINSIVEAVDKIKQSAVASRRCFVVEVMGGKCGYLALMSALATGAERVYLHEEGVKVSDLQHDVDLLVEGFSHGKRLGLVIRNESANDVYDTPFICALFEEEGGELFEVRQAVLGHLQQGGTPTPFDRIQATRFAVKCIEYLEEKAMKGQPDAAAIGLNRGEYTFTNFHTLLDGFDLEMQRPHEQWWMKLRPIARMLAQPKERFIERRGETD
ncbi:6-phosphofructokinase [Chloroflexi bacterium TSY]|nr:6-phosphofructokinase [Chloroflexi bacterium TSY]